MKLPIVHNTADWTPLMTDSAAWEEALHHITERAGLEFGEIEPGFPGTCAVFQVKPVEKNSYYIKIFPPVSRADFSKEASVLEFLSGKPLIPKLLAQGTLRGDCDFPYLVTQAVPGHALRDSRPLIPEAEGIRVASRLGLAVRDLHGLDLKSFRAFPKDESSWTRFIRKRREECLPELAKENLLSPSLMDEIHSFLGRAEPSPSRLPPRLLHGDITEDHVYLEEARGVWKLSGLIDFGDVEAGDPFYEWSPLWFGTFDGKAPLFRAFLRAYEPRIPLNRLFRERAMAFSLFHRFGPSSILSQIRAASLSTQGWGLEDFLEWLWPEALES